MTGNPAGEKNDNFALAVPLRGLVFLVLSLVFPLAGCDQINDTLGLEDSAKKEARMEADGRSVGGACRHSGRAIEDCFAIYSWLPRAAVFAGWRDMDSYMRENNIETVEPQLPPVAPPTAPGKKAHKADQGQDDKHAAKSGKSKSGKSADEAAEKSADEGDEKAKEGATEKAQEKPAEKPAERSADKTTEKPAEKPSEKTADKTKSEKPAEKPEAAKESKPAAGKAKI